MDLKEEFNKSEVSSEPLAKEALIKSSRVSSGTDKKEGEVWGDGFHPLS